MPVQGVVVGDVAEYAGPYYECDANVRSECCLPIYNAHGAVTGPCPPNHIIHCLPSTSHSPLLMHDPFSHPTGIIDAEAFKPHVFTPAAIITLAATCMSIPSIDPLYQ